MNITILEYVDLERVLLNIREDSSIVCSLILDALHSFRYHKISSAGIAQILRDKETLLTSSNDKMEGLLDALREYQLIHPLHHSVFDQLCLIITNECISDCDQPKNWVKKALVLLSENYDRKRLELLIKTAISPYPVSSHYISELLNTIEQSVKVANVTESNFTEWSECQIRLVNNAKERMKRVKSSIPDYLTVLIDILRAKYLDLPDGFENMIMDVREVKKALLEAKNALLQACSSEISLKKNILKWTFFVIGLLFTFCVFYFISPLIINHWDDAESRLAIMREIITSIALLLYISGFYGVRRSLKKRIKSGIDKIISSSNMGKAVSEAEKILKEYDKK